ncbi:MAG TPA: hypothetical protein VFL86_12615 [Burkholderiaceae bacterium]|nr:hypothetical protein [Burkholderiaceae bacterium]
MSPAWTAGPNNGAVPAATPPSIDESKGHDSRIVRVVTHFTPHFTPYFPPHFPPHLSLPNFPQTIFPFLIAQFRHVTLQLQEKSISTPARFSAA